MNTKEQERKDAIEELRKVLRPGDTVYTVLRHVSRSGMSRNLDIYIVKDNEPRRMTWSVALATGFTYDRKAEALKVGGCGMDVGFEVVYNLGYALFPGGFGCTGEHCPSNDHANGDGDYTPHGNGMTPHLRDVLIGKDHWHKEGGYALRQRWM